MEPCIIIHGGCRTIPDEHKESVRQGVKLAARKGYEVLLEVKCADRHIYRVIRRISCTSSTRKRLSVKKNKSRKEKTLKCVLIDALRLRCTEEQMVRKFIGNELTVKSIN